uniref:Dynamin-related protein 3A n=1 Tax=Rhizophora mucronata TaxID=61149 RepID=A0A2P2MPS0_RHIMU
MMESEEKCVPSWAKVCSQWKILNKQITRRWNFFSICSRTNTLVR